MNPGAAVRLWSDITSFVSGKEVKMPIFMDRHDVPGATAVDLATAHRKDLEVQDTFGCRALTYWFDEIRGVAFCLIEAPGAEAVSQMHRAAHGMVPNRIIEVGADLVEAFLGRLGDPASVRGAGSTPLWIFEDAAFRTILAVELKDGAVLTAKYGVDAARSMHEEIDLLIGRAVDQHNGGQTSKFDDTVLVTFASASDAVECAREIQSELNSYTPRPPVPPGAGLSAGIGLSAGDPVTEKNDLFEEAIQTAKRLCRIVRGNRIVVASAVRNEYRKEGSLPLLSGDQLTALDPTDEKFLADLMEIAESTWNDETIRVEDLSRQIGRSKSQLSRRLQALTGYTPKELVRDFRLRKALELLLERRGNVSEIAFEAGFSSAAYFTKCFQDRFGILPSVSLKQVH